MWDVDECMRTCQNILGLDVIMGDVEATAVEEVVEFGRVRRSDGDGWNNILCTFATS